MSALQNQPLPFLYQLQNTSYDSLSDIQFSVGVVDIDDTALTKNEVDTLQNSGKILFSYLSIGEAEDYRDYWINNDWSNNLPSFVLKENPEFAGNFSVKFWDPEWQEIIMNKVKAIVDKGYSGMYLDIVDGYEVEQVIQAYDGSGDIREDMISFVIKLSEYGKSLNPDFTVISQNALGLLSINDAIPTQPNTRFLNAIDGIGKEDTWYDDDDAIDNPEYELAFLEFALTAGKFILATDYPSIDASQKDFIAKALAAGYIPFVGTRDLDDTIDADNYTILNQLPSDWLSTIKKNTLNSNPKSELLEDAYDNILFGTINADTLYGREGNDTLKGNSGADFLQGNQGEDRLNGNDNNDTILGGDDNDIIHGGKKDDSINGNIGEDLIYGDKGNDTIHGGQNNDHLFGGEGNDLLFGDKGNDTLNGGMGADIFIFKANSGIDIINDFTTGSDKIQIASTIIPSAEIALKTITFSGTNALLDLGGGNNITLIDITQNIFSETDIIII